jgi:hypothetical protein
MTHPSPVGWFLARFGVPAILLVFYVTAALHFDYTPDGTYAVARSAEQLCAGASWQNDEGPAVPWVLLSATGGLLGLKPILVAKVFSLLFCSMAILLAYLFAVELLDDRVMALLVALAVASQAWLIQCAASGSGVALTLALTMATVFFLLRNEYLLAVLCVGIATMITWQAGGLLIGLVVDSVVNSRDRWRGVTVGFAVLMVFIAMILPWILYASWAGLPVLTGLPPVDIPTVPSLAVWVTMLFAVIMGVLGYAADGAAGGARPAFLNHLGLLCVITWCLAAGLMGESDLWRLAVPCLLALVYFGLERYRRWRSGAAPSYGTALVFAAALLIAAQAEFLLQTKPTMRDTATETEDLISIAYWLRSGQPAVRFSAERRGVVEYYVRRQAMAPGTGEQPDFVVSAAPELQGYEMVYAPPLQLEPGRSGKQYKVWRKL